MNKKINIYVICLALIILDCSYSFFTKSVLHGLLTIICLIMFFSFLAIYKERKKISLGAILVYLAICAGSIIANRGEVFWLIVAPISRLPILTLFMLKEDDIKSLAININRIFYVLISISLSLYIADKVFSGIPSLGVSTCNGYEYENFFYIYTAVKNYEGNFSGFCMEPGYFAPLCICLLALNRFNIRERGSILYVISILLSMSLEGYLLLAVGFVISAYTKQKQIKKAIIYSIIPLCMVAFFIFVAMNYNDGNNIVAEKILERLVFDEELGIAGNNRENYIVKPIIDQFFYSNAVWLGVGADTLIKAINVNNADACSWRIFVCVNGAIYTIILFVTSICGLLKTNIRRTLPLFVIFWMDFYPHGDPFSEIMYFLLIVCLMNVDKTKSQYNSANRELRLQRV